MKKRYIDDLALFGGSNLFDIPKPTSGLYRPSEERFLSYARSLFTTQQLTNNGPLVRELEKRLAELHGTASCATFCSGFMALLLSIYALALPGCTEVIMPSATYRRMAAIVRWAGMEPCFTDIDPQTLGVNAELFRPLISTKTALLLGVHPIVNMSAAEDLEMLSAESGIPLLFDSVEAAYGTIAGRKIGGFGRAEVFSMHASKFINGFEGGYITTNDLELRDKLKRMEAFGFQKRDVITELGCNAKLNELHAAMSLACLDEIEEQLRHNKIIFKRYKSGLEGLPLHLFKYATNETRTWKNVVVKFEEEWELTRDELLQLLEAENILARPYYTPPLHIAEQGFVTTVLPVTEAITASTCVLPSGTHVSEQDVDIISDTLHFIYKHRQMLKVMLREKGHMYEKKPL
ncbi:aminotransferase class I/II-fold pyridoxal phosphate-dependent enzyme [Desulfobulbus sp.]|uniref:DegT/DnrJ/EryC1/StrS family aminotransferase n=1 Tax=Desulfobulbus sp. TaxID=895 RepID=UPI00286F175F|nr:aminotransferase class I/II-fold pyridoxal phosphate-dependent enzyme [Desulfobulbus sp.]